MDVVNEEEERCSMTRGPRVAVPRKIRMAPTGMGMGVVGMTAVFLVVYVAVARGIWGQAAPAQQ